MYGTLISTVTVGAGGAANITFTSIPQSFTDLIFVISHRNATAANSDNLILQINGSGSFVYGAQKIEGNGSAASAASTSSIASDQYPYSPAQTTTASSFGSTIYTFPNYVATGIKGWIIDNAFETNTGTPYLQLVNSVYNSSVSGITSLTIKTSANFSQYTSASLYGLK